MDVHVPQKYGIVGLNYSHPNLDMLNNPLLLSWERSKDNNSKDRQQGALRNENHWGSNAGMLYTSQVELRKDWCGGVLKMWHPLVIQHNYWKPSLSLLFFIGKSSTIRPFSIAMLGCQKNPAGTVPKISQNKCHVSQWFPFCWGNHIAILGGYTYFTTMWNCSISLANPYRVVHQSWNGTTGVCVCGLLWHKMQDSGCIVVLNVSYCTY